MIVICPSGCDDCDNTLICGGCALTKVACDGSLHVTAEPCCEACDH